MRATPAALAPDCESHRSTEFSAAILIGGARSSGIHLGLAREHLTASPRLGVSFAFAAALLLAAALAAFVHPRGEAPSLAEPADAIGLITQFPQLVALILGIWLYRKNRGWLVPPHQRRRIRWIRT